MASLWLRSPSLRKLLLLLSWLLIPIFCGSTNVVDRKLTSPNSENDSFQLGDGARIIGGFNATQGRFPYYAALVKFNGGFTGGAVLIAPDIILTAAHAWLGPNVKYLIQVGRYNQDDLNDNFEQFIATEYLPYPYYGIDATFSRDYMILVLNGTSTKTPIAINRNATLPLDRQALTIIGLGSINPDYVDLAPILQQVSVDVVANAVCEQSHDKTSSYQGEVTSDMICATNPGKDSCYGDSGGPLIIPGNSTASDLLVGISSWGDECASPIFPGVYARVSSVLAWIDATVCRYSKKPPSSFSCSSSNTFSPAPTPFTTTSPSKLIPVTVKIRIRFEAPKTWWFILNDRGEVVFLQPRFSYTDPLGVTTTTKRQVNLIAGESYTFVIKSEIGQGLDGLYVVSLGRPSEPEGPVLVSGGGSDSFEQEERTNFTIPSGSASAPTMAPSRSQAPSLSFAPTPVKQAITLLISIGEIQPDFGYYILNEAGNTVVNVTFTTFTAQVASIQKVYHLPSNRRYKFVIQSQDGIGLPLGNYSLTLGAPNEGGPLIFFGDGTFTSEQSFSFFLPLSFTAVPSSTPSEPPTLAPTVSASPTTPLQTITLIINFGFRPSSQFGYSFTDGDNHVVVNVPIGTFADTDVTTTKVYHFHSEQLFTFTILNSRFNGLFPGNYTILFGPPNGGGPVLVFSEGTIFSEAPRTFFLPSSRATSAPSKRPQAVIPSVAPATPTKKPSSRITAKPSISPVRRTPVPTRHRSTPVPTRRLRTSKPTRGSKTPKRTKPTKKGLDKAKGGRKVKAEPKAMVEGVNRIKGHFSGFPKSYIKGGYKHKN